ncbi:hypothetical protein SpAn4DRAFT_2024 [Sporomusa ovata]|uniref:Uncharacterized protein n=1 Tax=Sporomusa ovata TaxID=2378 RepID=A0A0U1KUE5_9FIRM|nr:hypothetical protein SpAn4DRAFT_2024 [Sporomusa ovata]
MLKVKMKATPSYTIIKMLIIRKFLLGCGLTRSKRAHLLKFPLVQPLL